MLDLLLFITIFLAGTPCEIYFTYFSFKLVNLGQRLYFSRQYVPYCCPRVRNLLYPKLIWLDFRISRSGFSVLTLRGSFVDKTFMYFGFSTFLILYISMQMQITQLFQCKVDDSISFSEISLLRSFKGKKTPPNPKQQLPSYANAHLSQIKTVAAMNSDLIPLIHKHWHCKTSAIWLKCSNK